MEKLEIEADVLIIGGGLAGIWAAIRAKDFADEVVLVDKARVSRSGASTSAAGVILAPQDDDNLNIWMQEIVERGEYFSDQDWVEKLLVDQIARIKDMESWGIPFERNEEGGLKRIVGRGHEHTRILMFHGKELMEKMREVLIRKGVKLLERVMVTDLLTSDGEHPTNGRIVGAVGFNYRTGELCVFRSKATVIATGSIFPKTGGRCVDNTNGDGCAMGFRAGADLSSMELSTEGHVSVWRRKYWIVGLNLYQGLGVWFLNNKGERFMEKYDPVLKERARLSSLCQAFCKEALDGNGPIYADMRHFPPESFSLMDRVIPHCMRIFRKANIDLSKEKVEVGASVGIANGCGNGGIRINLFGETNIEGLFGAGAATKTLPHGTYSVGGVNLAYCCVSGYTAGEFAAKYAKDIPHPVPDSKQVDQLLELAITPIKKDSGESVDHLFDEIRRMTVPAPFSVFKSEKRIKKVLEKLKDINQISENIFARDWHELVKVNEFKNYLSCGELIYQAALVREESRGDHYRQEFPYRDDEHWLKWIIINNGNSNPVFRMKNIPIYRYPIKPERYEKIPNPVQIKIED